MVQIVITASEIVRWHNSKQYTVTYTYFIDNQGLEKVEICFHLFKCLNDASSHDDII